MATVDGSRTTYTIGRNQTEVLLATSDAVELSVRSRAWRHVPSGFALRDVRDIARLRPTATASLPIARS